MILFIIRLRATAPGPASNLTNPRMEMPARSTRSPVARLEPQAGLEDRRGVEIELGVERALDRRRLAEAVLLAGEEEIADGQLLALERRNHHRRLIWRHHLVFFALKEDDGRGEAIDRVDRRALDVGLPVLRIRSDEPVDVVRL